jgi:hypothetical protein
MAQADIDVAELAFALAGSALLIGPRSRDLWEGVAS